jgi:hypothetical protein
MSDRARLLRALRRQDLAAFNQKVFSTLDPGTTYEHNWHLDHVCWQLMRVARGEVPRRGKGYECGGAERGHAATCDDRCRSGLRIDERKALRAHATLPVLSCPVAIPVALASWAAEGVGWRRKRSWSLSRASSSSSMARIALP